MKTFEECKDEVALNSGHKSWKDMEDKLSSMGLRLASSHWSTAATFYARECCQASLNKAIHEEYFERAKVNICKYAGYLEREVRDLEALRDQNEISRIEKKGYQVEINEIKTEIAAIYKSHRALLSITNPSNIVLL